MGWLDQNRARAGAKYEEIRDGLIKIFTARGCTDAEDLADETINRVSMRAAEISKDYAGDPAPYFYATAKAIYMEYLRRRQAPWHDAPPGLPPAAEPSEMEHRYSCLDLCMRRLSEEQRDLVLRYFSEEKRAKIEARKRLAEELGIPVNALRIRVHKIRVSLERCIQECLSQGGDNA